MAYLALELRKRGHEVLLTCRDYEYTVGAVKRVGIEPVVVGSYSEGGPYEKVKADIDRMASLLSVVREFSPEALIAYPNPPAARLAFGVGIKYIALTDSPHSELPSRLSLPLAHTVIFSSCIPTESIERYVFRGKTRLVQYNGVDELVWLLRARPKLEYVHMLGLREWRYIVFRPHESLATYYKGKNVDVIIEELIRKISEVVDHVIVLPRYRRHFSIMDKLIQEGIDNIKVLRGGYDGVSLTYFARAVITGGSTLAREASLLMTPGITYYPGKLYVNECVAEKGYPLYVAGTTREILDLITRLKNYRRKNFHEILQKLHTDFEDPVNVVINELER